MREAVTIGIFWIALGLLCYVHFGYPLILVALKRFRPRVVRRGEVCPAVDFLIGAYNEEGVIREKLENCLALDYPRDRLRIIVASDASTDRTDAIVMEYQDRGVQLIVSPCRRGKAVNFREIVPGLKGEIVLFSDAGSFYRADTLQKMMRNFADPEVGCVGGRLRYRNPDATSVSQGEGLYWGYEVFLRKSESAIGSAMVLSGAVYAIRRELYRPVPDDLPDDFLCPLQVLDQGKRVLYEADTEISEKMATSARAEMLTKVRIISGNFAALRTMKHLLNPVRNPLVALQLLSHRLLRWFILPLAALMLLASLLLAHRPFYLLALVGQLLFYSLAGVGWLMDLGGKRSRLAFLPYYFVLVNLAAAWGAWNGLANRGRGTGIWEPVER
ncbi:MAG: glycosyltransferase family 2 protein [Acidobacteria bacterium]|nr:glycosyltransferase family 2 protein [Acidobacteriota bacterium]